MLKDITLGQYIHGDSFVHRLDPRTKIGAIFLYLIALFSANTLPAACLVCAMSFFILRITGLSLRYYWRGVRPLWVILLFTALMQLFLTPGRALFSYWIFTPTQEGLVLAIFMCARLVLLVMVTSAMTLTTTPTTLTEGLERLMSPFSRFGFPAHELAMMMTIALRFIPTLIDEADKIIKAQTARGAAFDSGNIIARARALLPVLVPLFIGALDRADELALAMEARAYHGGQGRTRLIELAYQRKDAIAFGVMMAFVVATLLLRIFFERIW